MKRQTPPGWPILGLLALLTLAFVVLRVTECIDWSWWWVVSPLLAPVALVVGLLLFGVAAVVVIGVWRAATRAYYRRMFRDR